MNYITSIERIGIEKGIVQGLEQGIHTGEATLLMAVLQHRFGQDLPENIGTLLQQAPETQLKEWMIRALNANTLTDVFAPLH